ncbi:glutathione S-transferase family protein [Aestuariivirga sp.]|uniref:glutathione S-transferase family protein n=1 Tax=Aestuariivirga sp. TaxID=2650926 RepID=UPI0039E375E4
MTKPIIFYTNPMSRGRTVRWMLEEIGVPYRTEIVQYGAEMKGAAYTAINPMGKVPAIRHGDVVVTEQAAIVAYLADAFADKGLVPPSGNPARGAYYRWLFFTAAPAEYAAVDRSLGFIPETQQDRSRVGYGSYEDVLNTLEQALAGTVFLAGNSFSAADLYMTAFLNFAMMTGAIEKRPAFEAYTARHIARPAFQRAQQIDNDLMPKKD